jgi:hypothetical protein
MTMVQTVLIDNAVNSNPVTVTLGMTGQDVTVLANQQSFVPLPLPRGNFQITVTSAGSVTIALTFYNIVINPVTYSALAPAVAVMGVVPITGNVGASQVGVWNVGVNNFPATQAVTGTFFQATQPVSGTFWQATQPVSGTVTANEQGALSRTLNITGAILAKAGAGRLWGVSTIVNGAAGGTVNDAATTGGAAVANQMVQIDNVATDSFKSFAGGLPFTNGLVLIPSAGQTLAVFYT